MPHHVVIVGGGFGGLEVATDLGRTGVDVTLIDRRNFHLFQPLLYQVATGGLSAANIATPLRSILARYENVRVLLAEVSGFDVPGKAVVFADGSRESYDTLVLATGASHSYFGHSEWAAVAPGLKTIEDATEIRRRVFLAFERAERETDPAKVKELLTFVVVGGGPTGVELAGTLAELAHDTLRHEFRSIDPTHAKIVLVEGHPRVLPPYTPDLSEAAARQLAELGVTVRTGAEVTNITSEGATVQSGENREFIPARTVLWGAGVKASSLGQRITQTTGAQTDRIGRVVVQPDFTLAGHPEIFVIGDLANYPHQNGTPLPGIAPVAMQEGEYVARVILNRLKEQKPEPFHYRDYGMMATIGRRRAVAMIGRWKFTGYFAWLLWLFVHLMYLVAFVNRLLVLIQWAWNYFTWNRNARLITEEKNGKLKAEN
jgi:NADH dehydrogenase